MRSLLITILILSAFTGVVNAQETFSTTLEDQNEIAVTVYNNNRALVRDRREIEMVSGEISLKFMDVAQQIQPETVSIQSLSDPGKLFILEQNYEYDLMNPQKLMEKYVGKTVRLINKNENFDFFEVEAKLLSNNNGPIYEIDGEIFWGIRVRWCCRRSPKNSSPSPRSSGCSTTAPRHMRWRSPTSPAA